MLARNIPQTESIPIQIHQFYPLKLHLLLRCSVLVSLEEEFLAAAIVSNANGFGIVNPCTFRF